jgi:predicted ATPase
VSSKSPHASYTGADQAFSANGTYGVFKSLRLENFKGYRGKADSIPLAPLTIVIGPNNSGKSALLQSLLLLKQTFSDRPTVQLSTAGKDVDLGGFFEIVNGGSAGGRKSFSIGVTRDHRDKKQLTFRTPYSATHKTHDVNVADSIDATFGYDTKTGDVEIIHSEMRDGSKTLAKVGPKEGEWSAQGISDKAKEKLEIGYTWFLPNFFPRGLRGKEHKIDMRGLRKAFEVSLELNAHAWSWSAMFGSLRHVGPVRTRIPWQARVGQRTASEPNSAGENLVRLLANKETVEEENARLITLVDKWASKELKFLAKLRIEPIDQSKTLWSLVGDEIGGCPGINVAAMGQGIAHSLPVIAQSFLTGERGCLLIEQPELHLHPKGQSELADLFIGRLGKGRQFIIETHSEHLLLRVRRRVAETPDLARDVSILFVNKENGVSSVTQLKLNERGHFDNWPDGFFDEAYQEAMKLAMAQPAKPPHNAGHHD